MVSTANDNSVAWIANIGRGVNFTAGTTAIVIDGPDPTRTFFQANSAQGGKMWYAFGRNPSFDDGDIYVAQGQALIDISRRDIGNLITQDIRAVSSLNNVPCRTMIGSGKESRDMINFLYPPFVAQDGLSVGFTVGLTPIVIAGPDPKRVYVMFNASTINQLFFSFGNDPSVNNADVFIGTNQKGYSVRREDIGDLITQDIRVVAAAASVPSRILIGKRVES